MKIVICGNGKVGSTIARQLSSEGHDVVIIEKNTQLVNHATNSLDCLVIQGNAAVRDVQIEAGVPNADLLITVTNSDEVNLLCCLIAKKLGAKETIARVRNPEYSNDIQYIQNDLGLSMAVNPEMSAAVEIARSLRYPSAIKTDSFARGRVDLVELKVKPESILCDTSLKDLPRKCGVKVLVCAVVRDGEAFIPSGNFVLKEGDKLTITARPTDILLFFMAIGVPCQKLKNVMLIGGGRIAYYLTHMLLKMSYNVKIIERDEKHAKELALSFPKATIINADATDHEILEEEGIEETDACITLTGFDEENVLLGLYAISKNVKKVITKVNRIDFGDILSNVGIDSVIAPKKIIANHITRYVRAMHNSKGSDMETLTRIVDDQVEALEFLIKDTFKYQHIAFKNLKMKSSVLIASIVRNNQQIYPDGNAHLQNGDRVIVITTRSGFEVIEDIFER